MQVQSYFLNEAQILEHFLEMEKRFKRYTEKEKRFFPSLDYFINEDQDKLSLLKSQVDDMIHFVGLGSIPNKIKIEKLNNAAAIINLSETSFVDITIDEDVYNNKGFDKIFATLAHELGHKILKKSGLFFNGLLDFENEIYADLSTFYLGFGKFVMTGYNIIGERGIRTGYLTPETYAMAYVISEYLNGHNPDKTALPQKIKNLISTAEVQCKTKWIKDAINEESIKRQYKEFSVPIGTTATILEIFNQIILKEGTIVRDFITRLNNTFIQNSNKTPLDYRKIAITNATFQDNKDITSFLAKSNLDKLVQLIAFIVHNRGYNLDELLRTIKHKCPNCGATINNPSFKTEEGKRVFHIRCNKCQTQFAINNNITEIKDLILRNLPTYKEQTVDKEDEKFSSKTNENKSDSDKQYADFEDDQSIYIEYLQRELNHLKEKEEKWKALNWWQRLWYKE